MKCSACRKAEPVPKIIRVIDLGKDLGKLPAKVCPNCKERYFSSRIVKKIQDAQKKAGLWGLSGRAKIAESKDAISIQVKKKLAKLLGLKPGMEVELESIDENSFKVGTNPY